MAAKRGLPERVQLKNLDALFGIDQEQTGQVLDVTISELFPFKDHPFKVLDDEKMEQMVESVRENGILVPIMVRNRTDGGYEVISGHRRKHAAEIAGLDTIPVIIRDLTDDEAVIAMVDANLQREEILPSEKAFAYKMKFDALSHQGKKVCSNTSTQVGWKSETASAVGEMVGDSKNQVRRYIRLTELLPELLDMVDRT
ncbi:MAG: ParB/RepB/Spo0J family partition protein, partial [Lachnospiraceae bacterium]|nr:ParB/RepB/Spo0J family partition protein [Lachnospiraceae bacterium]